MSEFMIRFLMNNLFLSLLTVSFLGIKQLLGRVLTHRMQYSLWYCFLVLLAAPFLSLIPADFLKLPGGANFFHSSLALLPSLQEGAGARALASEGQFSDFAVSVSRRTSSVAGRALFLLWLPGIMVMLFRVIKTQASPAEPGGARLIRGMSAGDEAEKTGSGLQHGFSEIPCDYRTLFSADLRADPPDIRL